MAGRFTLEALFKAVDLWTAPIAKIERRFEAMTRNVRRSLGGLDKINEKISGGIKSMAFATAAAGAAAGTALVAFGKTGADFEQAIADVGAVSLMSRDQVADLEKKALELGATTKFSATEVANAMELMGRAGFSNAEILQTIPGVLSAAAAEGMGLADAAGIVSNVLKGMGLAVEETSRVADVLALASAATNSSIASLGESMATASTTARQFKIPLEDTVAAVALLQDVGLDASEAGTAVSTMLTKLAAPSKEAAKQMAALGVKFQDAHGNMLPLADILGQFDKAAKKSGGNMKTVAFFADLVGLRGQKAALNLKDLFTSGKVSDLTEKLKSASGTAEKMASFRMDTLGGDATKLGRAFDAIKIALFETQSGPLRGVVKSTTEWVNANKELIVQKVETFIQRIGENLPAIWLWTKRIGAAVVAFYAYSAAVKIATVGVAAFELAIGAASLISSGLAVVLGILATVTDASTIATAVSTAWTWLKTAATTAYNAVVWLGVAAMTAYGIVTSEASVNNVLATGIMAVMRAGFIAYNAVVGVGTAIVALWNAGTLLSTIRQGALVAVVWLAVAAQTALNAVMAINPMFLLGAGIILLIGLVVKFSGAWDWLKGKIAAVWDAITSKIQPVIDKVKAFVDMVKSAGSGVAKFLGFGDQQGTGDAGGSGGAPTLPGAAPMPVLTPSDAMSANVTERINTTKAELTIRDESGRAEMTKPSAAPGFKINLAQSGSFAPAQ